MMQKSLFNNTPSNILPCSGNAEYHEHFLSPTDANFYFKELWHQTPWQNDVVTMFGKTITTGRKMAWYSDQLKPYTYSKQSHQALPFTEQLHQLRLKIEQYTGASYNACLLNLYQNGTQSMGWHQDNEPEISAQSSIASLSLGAVRPFQFRQIQSGETIKLMLHHGSLLNMFGETQLFWKHQLPKALKIKNPRINLTFRHMM